jgi:hypothetical protein
LHGRQHSKPGRAREQSERPGGVWGRSPHSERSELIRGRRERGRKRGKRKKEWREKKGEKEKGKGGKREREEEVEEKERVPVEASEYEIELTRVGVEAEKDSTEPNAVHYHLQLMLPNTPRLLVQQLHDMCNIENCSLWDETLENACKEMDVVVETSAHNDSDEEYAEQGTGGHMSLEEMERLLSGV